MSRPPNAIELSMALGVADVAEGLSYTGTHVADVRGVSMNRLQHWMCVAGASNWSWFRRWVGGRWERWFVDVCHSFIWMHEPEYMEWSRRPPCCFGTPTVEDYSPTACWCPRCDWNLQRCGEVIKDDELEGVHYRCARCQTWSLWLFDAPAPILLDWRSASGPYR